MIRPTFRRKIGGAFALLSILTLISGTLGLLFARSVLTTLRSVSIDDQPIISSLDELDVYLRQAVALSRAVSADSPGTNVADLRTEIERLKAESRAALTDLRRLVEDKELTDWFANTGREQEELVGHIWELLDRQMEAMNVRSKLSEASDLWRRAWGSIFSDVETLVDELVRIAIDEIYFADDASVLVQPIADYQVILRNAYSQQAEFLIDAFMNDFENVTGRRVEIEAGFDALDTSLKKLGRMLPGRTTTFRINAIADSTESLRSALFGEIGVIDLAGLSFEVNSQVAEAEAVIEKDAADVIRSLDHIVRVADILTDGGGRSILLRSTPAFLTAIIAATIVVSIILTVLFSRTFTRPVSQLIDATRAVAQGDLSSRAAVRSGDELEFLSKSFNSMVEQIADSTERMDRIHEELERQVDDRTKDLRKQIADRIEAEEALRKSELQYRTIVENYPRGIIVMQDREGTCLSAGGEALSLFALTPEEAVGKNTADMFGFSTDPLNRRIHDAMKGVKQVLETRLLARDWQICLVPNTSAHEHTVETLTIIFTDITEEKGNRRKLVQADKLATLGTLVAGVAHEINNPNQSVLMAGQILKRVWGSIALVLSRNPGIEPDSLFGGIRYVDLTADMPGYIDSIIESSNRIEYIVRALKDYSRHGPREMTEDVNVNGVVESALVLTRRMLEQASKHISVNLCANLPPVAGDKVRLEQVVVNLIQNACQSLDDSSKAIRISTSWLSNENAVEVAVIDEGTGIPQQDLPRIADPFYTTKRSSGGTGLGLSVSNAIVREHGGILKFNSIEKCGTEVILRIPTKRL